MPFLQLLDRPRVVLLAEGGSGKTWELRESARRLRSEGKAAFFLRLEHVAHDFDSAFEVDAGSIDDFNAWLDSSETGWLLLDSIDESRLRSPQDFDRAVRMVALKVRRAMDRVRVLMTGRPSAWRAKSDLQLCDRFFPLVDGQAAASAEPTFEVLRLEVLTVAQVETYAKACGIVDVGPFLTAIDRAEAWSFTQRPFDLEELAEFWIQRNRIGSRLELMTSSIERRLGEGQDRAIAHPIARARAMQGAQMLAGALVLMRKQNIQVPDGVTSGPGISARDVLGWDDAEIAALLQRSLFDPDLYGSVRVHHRSVLDFLAAQWFNQLLTQEVSRQRVEELFFREQYGLPVPVPSLRSLLPWLARWDRRILARVQQVAPEVAFEGGDPLGLPTDTRSAILGAVCRQLADGTSDSGLVSYRVIERFANHDLSESVRRLSAEYMGNVEVAPFLMGMVRQGRLTEALPEAMALAKSASLPPGVRIAAFHAVAAVGSPADMDDLRSHFAGSGEPLDRRCMAEILALTERPDATALQWLIDCIPLLESFEEPYEHTSSDLASATARFLQRLAITDDQAADAIDKLGALLSAPPLVENLDYALSKRNGWLRRPLCVMLCELVGKRDELALRASSLAALHVLLLDMYYEHSTEGVNASDLAKGVQAWPALKWAWFWFIVDRDRAETQVANYLKAEATMRSVGWDEHNDFDAAIEATSTRERADDQRAALEIAFGLYARAGRPQGLLERMSSAVQGREALEVRLQQLADAPQDDSALIKMQQDIAVSAQRLKERSERFQERKRADALQIAGRLDSLRAPSVADPSFVSQEQAYLLERMRELEEGSHPRWTLGNWRSLEGEFGAPAARAFRDGLVNYWRKHAPKLVSEGADLVEVPHKDLFGLAGLTVEEVDTPGVVATLTLEEARVAFRYAMREMNALPTWFPALFEAYPQKLAAMLLSEVEFELQMDPPSPVTFYAIARIHHARDWLGESLAPGLHGLLSACSPKRPEQLVQLMEILQRSSLPDEAIASLAQHKMPLDGPLHLALWAAAWCSVQPGPAIDALEKQLDALPDPVQRTELFMAFAAYLVGSRHRYSTMRGRFKSPAVLRRLYLLAHKHVRADEDVDRSGKGAYTPGLRDDAQDARESLSRMLQAIPGREAFLALQSLSIEHPRTEYRPFLKRQAWARAQFDSERPPWTESQVREFAESYERAPANHRELFDLAVRRLLDLKHDTEDGDLSIASILVRAEKEVDLRKWIAEWCSRHPHGRFEINQEVELPDARRPDLRWTCSTFQGAVPTELKIAEKWSGLSLFERLKNQLAGDYLRDTASNRGIYLLVAQKSGEQWTLPDGRKVDFVALIEALQVHANSVAMTHPGIEEIQVIGIDLTKRAGPRVQAPASGNGADGKKVAVPTARKKRKP